MTRDVGRRGGSYLRSNDDDHRHQACCLKCQHGTRLAQMGLRAKQDVEPVEKPLDHGVPRELQAWEARNDAVRQHVKRSYKRRLDSNMITALENLANAAVQKNDTVEMLVISNKALTDFLAERNKECARLLAIIAALSTGRGASVGGGGGGGGGGENNRKISKTPWDPEGYCWSHRYKVRTGHSSASCCNKREGHDARLNAQRGDTQGGWQWSLAWKIKQSGKS